jgi:hypothetical protein
MRIITSSLPRGELHSPATLLAASSLTCSRATTTSLHCAPPDSDIFAVALNSRKQLHTCRFIPSAHPMGTLSNVQADAQNVERFNSLKKILFWAKLLMRR